MLFVVRFAYLDRENCAYDGDHTRGWSPPYARMEGCIRVYARRQSIAKAVKKYKKYRKSKIKLTP